MKHSTVTKTLRPHGSDQGSLSNNHPKCPKCPHNHLTVKDGLKIIYMKGHISTAIYSVKLKLCFKIHCREYFTTYLLLWWWRLSPDCTCKPRLSLTAQLQPLHRGLVMLLFKMIVLKSLNYSILSGLSFRMGLHSGLFGFSKRGIITSQTWRLFNLLPLNATVLISI